ncbi:hypothetical protein LTR56_008314 [Elasticomyces elasticus]|nr:hypothetical protein LTR56_008314 [Elasticomyces elasticus]KAK3661451.1 hypothetical protein LTR22_007460 [Elasticomyces elasticus]KAK4926192.1 hypothetical protein LTR49_006897 [Elasticomyces elasticus]KAK5750268.1 hypothetical protein LTS12_019685 [Elasticomyces elasticus]
MDILSNPTFIKAFAALNIVWIAVVAGCAISMYISSIPVISKAQDYSTAIMLRQFHDLINRGTKYLQGGRRIQAVLLIILVYLTYTHPDPEISGRWKYFAAATFIGAQVAWYEVVFVFPTNDRLVEMEAELIKAGGDADADRKARPEVLRLFDKWRYWHVGRIVIPFAAVAVGMPGLLWCLGYLIGALIHIMKQTPRPKYGQAEGEDDSRQLV